MLKFKKYKVCRFCPSLVRVIKKFPHGEWFFSPYGKFNDIHANHKQKSAIFTVQELAKDQLFILCWKIYRTVRDFYHTAWKISHHVGTCLGHVLC
jgi:hypothetical protein